MGLIYEPRGEAREYCSLACNLYRGCLHGCKYCYGPAALRRSADDYFGQAAPKANVLERLAKEAPAHRGQRVHLCFVGDPYPATTDVTREALEILQASGVNWQVLTKAGERATRDFDLYRAGDLFGATIVFVDEVIREEWEPRAAPTGSRHAALAEAKAQGIETWVSVEPVIYPGQALQVIEQFGPVVDLWRVGKLNHRKLPEPVDWDAFCERLAQVLSGKRYYIKRSLQPYWPRGVPVDTDAPASPESQREQLRLL